MPDITYEILALRYGIFDGRLQFQNYIIPDDHAAPDPLDFFVFAIRGNGRTIVMDTGFNPVSRANAAAANCCARRPRHCCKRASIRRRCRMWC